MIDRFWNTVRTNVDQPFMVTRQKTYSFGEIGGMAAVLSDVFRSEGVSRGERVVVYHPEEYHAVAAFLAAMLCGAVPSLVAPDSSAARVRHICETLEARCLATDSAVWEAGAPAPIVDVGRRSRRAEKSGFVRALLSGGSGQRRPGAEEIEAIQVERGSGGDLAYILFTSGTTSEPSGVEITWTNLTSHLSTLERLFCFDGKSRVFNATPIAHTDGLVLGPLLALWTGGAVLRPGSFVIAGIESWLSVLHQQQATHMITNPTVLALIERYASYDDYFRSGTFRGILCSASILRPELWARLESRFGVEIWNLYGLTETVTTALYAGRHPEMGAVGSIGVPIDCDARIQGLESEPLEQVPGVEGELQLRGAHIFRGYWRDRERNARTFVEGGWMRTGDLAQLRPDGSYNYLGRLKAAINTGGTLVRGEEIDACLLEHPAVIEAVTVALPDPVFEEVPASAVVVSSPVDVGALIAHCRQNLEALKVPKRIQIVESIPRGDSGKPRLAQLREMFATEKDASEGMTEKVADLDDIVLEVAAKVFRTARADLRLDSTPDDVANWDSFTHLNLVLALEREYDVRLPAASVASMNSLAAAGDAVRSVRGCG